MDQHLRTISRPAQVRPGHGRPFGWRLCVVAIALVATACSPTDEPAVVPPEDADEPDTALPGDDDPELPADDDAAPEAAPGPDDELPAGWETVIVPDDQTGPFQLNVPEATEVWAVGTSLAPLEQVAEGSDWWAFWEPRLASVDPETSNVRAMLALPDDVGVRSFQVNVNPYDLDVDPDDAEGIAQALALVAEAQGNEVNAIETRPYDGPEVDEVGQIVVSVDPELLDRDVWQRFYPAPSANALWSVQCDGPSGADLDAICSEVLDAFRPPVG
jgi:hypothetical protein